MLRTSITVDSNRVKTVPPSSVVHMPACWRCGAWAWLAGTQLWIKSGERVARPTAGPIRRDAAPAIAGVVLCAKDKAGKHRRTLEVETCFAPLPRWVLAWWPDEPGWSDSRRVEGAGVG